MAKDRRTHGRRVNKAQRLKRQKRLQARREARKNTDDGAGARDLSDPERHRRR
ncbi:MAG: hypothetical protein ACRD0W_09845 [Acidimicrobiales bacterium]